MTEEYNSGWVVGVGGTTCIVCEQVRGQFNCFFSALRIERGQVRESVYKLVCLSRREIERERGRQRERALAWLSSAVPFSSSLTVERGVSMDQYKVQGEPLVLSHSQERVL